MDQHPVGRLDERAALLRRIRDGEVCAFDEFLNGEWQPLVRYTTTLMGTVDDGKDIAQEAFVRLWESRASLRSDGSIKAFLYQIARNLAFNERHSRQLHNRLQQEQARPPRHRSTPATDLDAAELRVLVERAIEALPRRRREAFVLAHVHGLRHTEVAEVMGISAQGVANQVSAALADLREALAPYLGESSNRSIGGRG